MHTRLFFAVPRLHRFLVGASTSTAASRGHLPHVDELGGKLAGGVSESGNSTGVPLSTPILAIVAVVIVPRMASRSRKKDSVKVDIVCARVPVAVSDGHSANQ